MTPDIELLRQYAKNGNEAAFAELLRRHVNMVYSVALRVSRGNTALAEEVAQRVFTDLARKAGPLSHHPALPGWLHTSARFAALKTIRGEQRRQRREQEASIMHDDSNTAEFDWEQLRPVLDEAVGGLRETDRHAVVLRFFEGLSHREIGEALGLNENAARKRVDHALDKLRAYFARSGITVSSALLASTLTAHSQEIAPAGLAEKITHPSLAGAAGGAGLASATSWILLMSTKTQAALTIALIAVIVFIATALWWPSPSAPGSEKIAAAPDTPPSAAPLPPPAPPQLLAQAAAATPLVESREAQAKNELGPIIADIIQNLTDNPTYAVSSHLPGFEGSLQSLVEQSLMNASPEEAAALRQRMTDNNAALARSSGIRIRMAQFRAMQDATPTLNAAGNIATYDYTPETLAEIAAIRPDVPATSLPKSFQFIKIEGKWYIHDTAP